ncbi:acylphosphatase [bacterium]|jgi:acylphosphatase|nr:acylphosphatase [bacterium]MDP6571281.1 acylphosphatase [Patescibacteria group bacterium]MDP6756123.1 acylphosphatase [Patescibacteria group bacterium]|tara:strand:- start:18625 stop:18900 length:276 start_codon:yes stop_codon:yes gene_type:complete
MQKKCIIRVHGTVQGVGFRYTTRDLAQSLGVTGVIRNEPDGSVYIEAQGEEGQLKELVKQCKQGHDNFHVSKVETQWSDELGEYSDFTIER